MTGTYLRFYVSESAKHQQRLLYEWLLEHAKATGVPGGSAFRAVAGFGRHGVLHEQQFFELAGDLTIAIEFIVSDEMAEELLASIRKEKVNVIYTRMATQFGVTSATQD